MASKQSQVKRLYQQVANKLMALIDDEEYLTGTRLPAERKLAERFGVSRPTIREAIIALELAGYVEVKTGSGVYVIEHNKGSGPAAELNVGPFELSEARMLFEGEVAALAATLITDDEIEQLEKALEEIIVANKEEASSEQQDHQFHLIIAQATRNSAIVNVIDELWELKINSPLNERIFRKAREIGYRPGIEEHRAILEALRSHDSQAARNAMRAHLSRSINELLDATEIKAVEDARERITRDRRHFNLARQLD